MERWIIFTMPKSSFTVCSVTIQFLPNSTDLAISLDQIIHFYCKVVMVYQFTVWKISPVCYWEFLEVEMMMELHLAWIKSLME